MPKSNSQKLNFFSQVDENLQVAATISSEITNKVFILSLSEIVNFGENYKVAIVDYKSKYFRLKYHCLMFVYI